MMQSNPVGNVITNGKTVQFINAQGEKILNECGLSMSVESLG